MRALAEAGCEIIVVAGVPKGDKAGVVASSDYWGSHVCYVPYRTPWSGKRRLSRVWKRLCSEVFSINRFCGWATKASAAAMEVLVAHKVDMIMTISSPFESHLVGLMIKRKAGLPWITSFSDPWPSIILPPPYNAASVPILSRVQVRVMRRVLEKCDAVHMPNIHAIKWVEQRVSVPIMHKMYVIPHVASPLPEQVGCSNSGFLAHVGSLDRGRLSRPLLEAINDVATQHPQEFHGLLCVGPVCREFLAQVGRMKMEHFVKVLPAVSSEQAMMIARSSTAVLVIEANMPQSPFLPSKFVDYAGSGRPIIAVTPRISPIRDYLERFGGGCAVIHDRAEIAAAIRDAFVEKDSACSPLAPSGNSKLSDLFIPKHIANQYMEMMQGVLSSVDNASHVRREK